MQTLLPTKTMMFDDVASIWAAQIATGLPGQRRIDKHPLALYFGASDASKPTFFIKTNVEPAFPELSDIVSVERGKRVDGLWTLVLTLQRSALTDAFIGMCTELARRSAASSLESTARAIFFETLQDWKALLTGRVPRELSEESLRGLLAEIWFALEIMGATVPLSDVILAWHGPFGAPQDFQLASGEMFEVKSVHANSRAVEISSAEQLDPPSKAPLTLVLVTVEEVPIGFLGGYTLSSLIGLLHTRLNGDPNALRALDHRLEALGAEASDSRYADRAFTVGNPRSFTVSESFPRVLRKDIPLAIDRVKYRLQISGIDEFERKAKVQE